ncbi:hypothetical protein [Methylobacterium nigriterrae]|uniref:hypothetical protein n=1 Tax=Methylobacterium nigriterrae TaxID=3127512 RepID=UPI003D677F7F
MDAIAEFSFYAGAALIRLKHYKALLAGAMFAGARIKDPLPIDNGVLERPTRDRAGKIVRLRQLRSQLLGPVYLLGLTRLGAGFVWAQLA